MSEPIKVGDLVQVVRPTPCGHNTVVGRVFVVKSISRGSSFNWCLSCGHRWGPEDQAESGAYFGASLWRLKRIPPLSELEGQRTEEKLKETA